MKKIFFILAFFVININVSAISVTRGELSRNICSNDGEIYRMYYVNIQDRETYFLKPSKITDIDIEKYHDTSFELSSFPDGLKDYYFAFILFQKKFKSLYTYHALTQRLIWDYLYPEKEYKFCLDDKTTYLFHENEYQRVKQQIQSTISGPDFFNQENVQVSGITSEYKFEYFSNYYIYDNDSLEAYIKDDTLFVKGKPGNYKIKFKKNPITYPIYLFDNMMTNEENYLFSSHSQNDVVYEMNIKVRDNNIKVTLYDNDELLYNECVYYNNDKYCPNENGIINLPIISDDKYVIIYKENDRYKQAIINGKLSEINDIIKINLIKNSLDSGSVDSDNTYYEEDISFENTLAINNVPIILTFLLGVLFVKRKKH